MAVSVGDRVQDKVADYRGDPVARPAKTDARPQPGRLFQLVSAPPERETPSNDFDLDHPVWILAVRKTGHVNQCRALASALGVTPERVILIDGRAAADGWLRQCATHLRTLGQVARLLLATRPPDGVAVISSGRAATIPLGLWRRLRRTGIFSIHVGAPRVRTGFADVLVASRHQVAGEIVTEAGLTLAIDGVLAHRPDGIAPRPCMRDRHITMLVGGKNVTYDYCGPLFRASLDALKRAIADGATVSVVFSRRTYPDTQAMLRAALAGSGAEFVEVSDRSGYTRAMARASRFVVCPDSTTMVSECCATGRPVFVPEMDLLSGDTRNARFVRQFLAGGYIAPLAAFGWSVATRRLEDQAMRVAGPITRALAVWSEHRSR